MAKTNGTKKYLRLASVSAVAILCATGAHLAGAQTAPTPGPAATPAPPQAANSLPEVVVSARKRNEKLLSVPISISAFTSKDLKGRAIYSIQDLANQTAGLTQDSTVTSSGRNDRSFPTYTIRGMVPSLTTNPTTTVFLDGAPIISGQVDSLENLERVEVLKGPQSAYFGRETFGGAISLITKDPSQRPQVSIDSLIAYRNWYDQNITVEGPIVPGKLSLSAGFRYYSRQGSYANTAVADKTQQRLGDQSTKSGNFKVVLTPNDNLKVSVLGLYYHDSDGPSAQALIYPSQADCDGFWFCGTVPDRLSNLQPATNDLVSPAVHRFLDFLGTSASNQLFKPGKDQYGLVRDSYHGSIGIDYYLPQFGITLSSLTAADDQRFSELQDFYTDDGSQIADPFYQFAGPGSTPFANTYDDDPFFVEQAFRSLSQEFRITSDANQPFRYLFGVNYEYSRVDATLAGGGAFSFTSGDSPDTSTTAGFFYGLAYDFTPHLTLNFEGRLQQDNESTSPYSAPGTAPFNTIKGTYRDFLPRISLQYKFSPTLMSYITYSRGVNPGTFNGDIVGLDPAEKAIVENTYGAKVRVAPEELTNFELGTKGSFFNDKLQVSADVYYDIWYNQINASNITYFVGDTLENTAVYTNIGKTDLDGIEADATWEPLRGLVLNGDGAINNSSIVNANCVTCAQVTGTTVVKHKRLPDVSLYQLALGAQYNGSFEFLAGSPLTAIHDWGYYGRADYIFKSPQFEDEDNLVATPSENLVNLRVGVSHGPLTIEAFVDNVTNYGGPTALSGFYNTQSVTENFSRYDSVLGGLPYLRSFGLRLRYTFGL